MTGWREHPPLTLRAPARAEWEELEMGTGTTSAGRGMQGRHHDNTRDTPGCEDGAGSNEMMGIVALVVVAG
jgi:hypothetical protein